MSRFAEWVYTHRDDQIAPDQLKFEEYAEAFANSEIDRLLSRLAAEAVTIERLMPVPFNWVAYRNQGSRGDDKQSLLDHIGFNAKE